MNTSSFFKAFGNARRAISANKVQHQAADHQATRFVVLAAMVVTCLMPELAMAGPWDGMGTNILAIFTGGLTRTIAIIAVIAAGIAALAGKLSWDWVIKITVGVCLIFGSAAIVDYLIAAAA